MAVQHSAALGALHTFYLWWIAVNVGKLTEKPNDSFNLPLCLIEYVGQSDWVIYV
jgi:hypothetical protein